MSNIVLPKISVHTYKTLPNQIQGQSLDTIVHQDMLQDFKSKNGHDNECQKLYALGRYTIFAVGQHLSQ